ncbi:MAG: hypothetical protein QM737_02395 [Ferruginibacter sp.]
MTKKEFPSLLQSVIMHWQQTTKTYADYMEHGKKFRYAEILMLHNTAVKNLLTHNIAIIPVDLIKDVEAIIEHYTIWSAKWYELRNKLNPGPDDVFVFENDHRFPRAAAQRLEAVFHELA